MPSIFRGMCSTLDVSMFMLRGRRNTLDLSCCVLFANRIVRAASSGDNVQIARQAWDIARMSFCMARAVFGANLLSVECHFAWQARYFEHSKLTLYTLQSTLYT